MLALIVLAKAPLRGFAKTRLGGNGLSQDLVARLADAFLRDTLRTCSLVDGVEVVVCFAPHDARAYFRGLAPSAHLVPQVDGDLGARLSGAFDATFALGATRAVLVGMDTPHLSSRPICDAFGELERADCVLGPASDGGYYLIGLRQSQRDLFMGIEWSTERVLAQTLARARAARVTTALVDELFDIDDRAALERLEGELGPGGEPCPHTARVIGEWRAAENGMDGARG